MMTSKIGNNIAGKQLLVNRRGITFVEVMVTIVILSVGLVSLFRVFQSSISHLEHLTNRIYASNLLENRFARIQRLLSSANTLPVETDQEENISIGARILKVKKGTGIGQVDNFVDIFRLDLSVSWAEGQKKITLKRSGIVVDWDYIPGTDR
jgi:prepilin-type N-terminal cleavage/methylation domain-containing protein